MKGLTTRTTRDLTFKIFDSVTTYNNKLAKEHGLSTTSESISLEELFEGDVEVAAFQNDGFVYNYFDFALSSFNGEKFENYNTAVVTIGIITNPLDSKDLGALYATVVPCMEFANPNSPTLKVAINEINSWLPGKVVIATQDGHIAKKGELFITIENRISWLKAMSTDLIFELLQEAIGESDLVVGELKEKGINIADRDLA